MHRCACLFLCPIASYNYLCKALARIYHRVTDACDTCTSKTSCLKTPSKFVKLCLQHTIRPTHTGTACSVKSAILLLHHSRTSRLVPIILEPKSAHLKLLLFDPPERLVACFCMLSLSLTLSLSLSLSLSLPQAQQNPTVLHRCDRLYVLHL